MKESVQMKKIEARMAPGVISLDGFLGSDRRSLSEILAADEAEAARLSLSHRAIADRMRSLREAGAAGLGEAVPVAPHFEVRVDSDRGGLACPFGDKGGVRKTVTTVLNKKLGRSIRYTDLNIHMIEAHGFYEGKGSPFRLEIADLAQILEIEGGA